MVQVITKEALASVEVDLEKLRAEISSQRVERDALTSSIASLKARAAVMNGEVAAMRGFLVKHEQEELKTEEGSK